MTQKEFIEYVKKEFLEWACNSQPSSDAMCHIGKALDKLTKPKKVTNLVVKDMSGNIIIKADNAEIE